MSLKKVLLVVMVSNIITAISALTLAIGVLSGGEFELSFDNGGAQKTTTKKTADKGAISKKYDNGMTLQKALKKDKPMAVLFYADWCGFCKRFAPLYKELSKDADLKKEFNFVYVNSEDQKNAEYFREYQIKGFPTLYLVNQKGEKVQIPNNLMFQENSKDILKEKFEAFLEGGANAVQPPFVKEATSEQ
ncbi:thioredoxin fold domain-containing protein [bacterium]|nr:thioredoxin fold domain-containing protein [bacterium]